MDDPLEYRILPGMICCGARKVVTSSLKGDDSLTITLEVLKDDQRQLSDEDDHG